MAKKKAPPKIERPEVASDSVKGAPSARIAKIRKNYERGTSAEAENRRLLSEDLNFVFNAEDSNAQWDQVVLQTRRSRPSYTYNRVLHPVKMVYGDYLNIEPTIKVRASNKQSSVATANIWEGLIRAAEADSRARQGAYDPAMKFAIAGGYGLFRLLPEYQDDESMNQVIRFKGVPNPQTGFWNPECQDPFLFDMVWGGFGETIAKETYEALYPDFAPQTFSMSRDSKGWIADNQIRIVEYFEKVRGKKTIAELDDNRIINLDTHGKLIEHAQKNNMRVPDIKRTRDVKTWQVEWVKVDGFNILEGPITYNWQHIPFVRIPGNYIAIEGRKKCQSLIRHSKDAQRTYNLHRSTMIESVALTPRAPYLVTPRMIKQYEGMWATANTTNRPYLLYDADEDAAKAGASAMPQRAAPPDVPSGLVALAQQDVADIQAATGYFDASLGSAVSDSDRTSGQALVQRQRRGDLGSYEFLENFRGALEVAYRIFIDMGKSVYDTEQMLRIVGQDMVEDFVKINGQGSGDLVHDLSKGSYDVTCTVGPGYATARQEQLETLLEAMARVPAFANMGPDIIARLMDIPEAEELARRVRIPLIQQGFVKPSAEDQAQLPPPKQPDPMQVAELQEKQAKAQKAGADAQIAHSKASVGPLELERLVTDIANKHLTNITLAQQITSPDAETKADQEEAKAGGAGAPQAPSAAPGGQAPPPVQVNSPAEAAQLPSGTHFLTHDGQHLVRH